MKNFFLLCLAGVLFWVPRLHADDSSDDVTTAATAIEVTGNVQYESTEGQYSPVTVGQLFAEGDHIVTKEESGVHLVLADGSSVILGSNSEITLDKLGNGSDGSETFIQLLKGAANAIVEKLKPGSAFEMTSPNSVAAVKGTDFEISDDGSRGSVTVREGLVSMGDAGRVHVVDVGPYQRSWAGGGYTPGARALSSDEIRGFQNRWAHAHAMHLQRQVYLHRFAGNYHARLQALRNRHATLQRFRARESGRISRFRQLRAHRPMRPGGPAHPLSKGEMRRGHEDRLSGRTHNEGHRALRPKKRRRPEH